MGSDPTVICAFPVGAVHSTGDKLGLNGEGIEPVGLHDLRHKGHDDFEGFIL
jgi:hypothetical protein